MKSRSLALLAVLLVTASSALALQAPDRWRVPGDFPTLQAAIDSPAVGDGDLVRVRSGSHAGALVDKAVRIVGQGRATIDDGPPHPAGLSQGIRLLEGSDGASIEHLAFTVDLAIMNGDGVDDVTVRHNRFVDAIQAISAWRGSDWGISHNTIEGLRTRCGGGIGILLGDFDGGTVSGNIVQHNEVRGTLHVDPDDCGGYNGSGIVLFADFRFGRAGTSAVSANTVLENRVDLASDAPGVVDVVAFEITDTRDDATLDPVLFDNTVAFNDFRRTALQVALTPDALDEVNALTRNLGANRRADGGPTPGTIFRPGH